MSQSNSTLSLSPNNRPPYYSSPALPDYRSEYNLLQRRPYKILPQGPLELLNGLLKKLDNKENHILCLSCDKLKLEEEIKKLKEKVAALEIVISVESVGRVADSQLYMTTIADLKAEGVRRYMDHLDFRTAVKMPNSNTWLSNGGPGSGM